MSKQKRDKLNWLQRNLPDGLLVDAAWLERHAYSSALRSKYVSTGWLDQVARGVYRRLQEAQPSRPVPTWQQVVISLQTLLDVPAAVGGKTALELQGFSHYLSAGGPRQIHLYSDTALPGWLKKLQLPVTFVPHNAKRLFAHESMASAFASLRGKTEAETHSDSDLLHSTLTHQRSSDASSPLLLSTPERAVLELLDELPKKESFHQVDMLMEGMRTLSPRRLNKLLVDCRSVKVKRLFLWFAERHQHSWFNKLETKNIDLGKGKRMVVRGGKLDPKYEITVPQNLDANG